MRGRLDPWLVLSLLLLATFGFLGTWIGFNDLPDVETRLQLMAIITQIVYGLLSLVAIVALLVGWRGIRIVLQTWAVALSISGGLAPVAWGGASPGVGIAAFIFALVVALAIIWVVRRAQVAP